MISEIFQHIYPIVRHDNNEYSIADIKLPPAEDKSYQTLSLLIKSFDFCMINFFVFI